MHCVFLGHFVSRCMNLEATGITYLARAVESGMYYWRARIGAKTLKGSLRTKSLSSAKAALPIVLAAARKREHSKSGAPEGGEVTAGDWVRSHVRSRSADPSRKNSTKEGYATTLKAVAKADWFSKPVKSVSVSDLEKWWERQDVFSATYSNRMLSAVKAGFELAREARVIEVSTAKGLMRMKSQRSFVEPPNLLDVHAVADHLEKNARFYHSSGNAAIIRFIVVTGLRIGEALEVVHSDFLARGVRVTGGEEGTKNMKGRVVPWNPELRRLASFYGWGEGCGKVFHSAAINESISRACELLKIRKFSPHSLRHLFATMCIQQGVDFATLGGWLGHSDGGVLAARTYSHLIAAHSDSLAARLSLGEGEQ